MDGKKRDEGEKFENKELKKKKSCAEGTKVEEEFSKEEEEQGKMP